MERRAYPQAKTVCAFVCVAIAPGLSRPLRARPSPPLFAAPTATHEEMKAARLPLSFRDYCSHLLIPLNKCRRETMYMPWKCSDERHSYEKCQYVE
jgi:hypothetical protein